MSSAPPEPTPSPIPIRPSSPSKQIPETTNRPISKPSFPTPKLRVQIHDLSHPGAALFLTHCKISCALSDAVQTVLTTLYDPTSTNSHIPPTRSVTLVLEEMGGVAYTTGISLDDDHKEIHMSLNYIHQRADAVRDAGEIDGVLVHEMVHAWQHNAKQTCPGGLIEGIADFVRLKAGLSPSHWKRPTKKGDKWDSGYQITAYFLEWLEKRDGEGAVRRINAALQGEVYDEEAFWRKLFGSGVEELWDEYQRPLPDEDSDGKETKAETAEPKY